MPLTSPNFVYNEFLFVNVVVNVQRRAREHVVSVLQQNRIIAVIVALIAGRLPGNHYCWHALTLYSADAIIVPH